MSSRFVMPFADVGDGISPADGAKLHFLATGTDDDKNTFTDESLGTPNANPVIADADGVFPDIWMNDGDRYKVRLTYKNNAQVWEVDPVIGGLLNGASGLIFDTVAAMKLTDGVAGQRATTLGYYEAGDGGGAVYLISAAASVDGYGDHTLANGTIALLQTDYVTGFQYGALTADATEELQAAITAQAFSKLHLNEYVHTITAALTTISPLIIEGSGAFAPTDVNEGTVISNVTNDVEAFVFDGNAGRVDRMRMRDLTILHEAATKYAIRADWAPFFEADNVVIDCNGVGFGGILFGDELDTPVSQAFLGSGKTLRIIEYTDYGVRVNSTGTLWNFTNCIVGSSVDGAVGGFFNKEGVRLIGGQWSSNNTGGISISDYNSGSGDREGNVFEGQVFESTSNKCVSFDGDTRSVVGGRLQDAYANLSSVSGVVCYFGRAKQCTIEAPKIKNPTGGGTLCEWSANARECVLICDIEGAQAPVTVDASAVRALKVVTGVVGTSDFSLITTDSNMTTMLKDGLVSLPPEFVPVHNGVAWNFQTVTLSDDTAISFTPPTVMGQLRVINDDDASTFGIIAYNADATTAQCEAIAAGSSFEATTGALNGTTGTNNTVTVSADTNGDIYIEARKGTANLTVFFESAVFGV